MGINVLKGYGRHDNIKTQNRSFVTVFAKVWVIVSCKVESWTNIKTGRTQGKRQSRNEIINVDFTLISKQFFEGLRCHIRAKKTKVLFFF